MSHDYIRTGSPIYARSFEIIREKSNLGRFPDDSGVEYITVLGRRGERDGQSSRDHE